MSELAALDPDRLAVVTWDLPDVDDRRSIDPEQLTELIGWAADERLTGLLVGRFESAGTPPPSQVVDVHHAALRHSLAVEAHAARAVSILHDAGITAVLFKGIAAAHADYAVPAHRTFFDADLLVPRRDFLLAVDTLCAHGCVAEPLPLGRSWMSSYGRAIAVRDGDGLHVDVHAAIAPGFFGVRLDHTVLVGSPSAITLGGTPCPTFDGAGRLLATAYALVLSRGPSLRLCRDLAQLLAAGTDWRDAAVRAGDGDVVVATGIVAIRGMLRVDHPALEWARDRLAAGRPHDRHATAATDWASDARSELRALGWTRRVGYAAGIGRARANDAFRRRRTRSSR